MAVDTAAHTFTATYTFANAATAKIADAGALRSMSWQNLDANANRQGVTIQEDGELGGPGFGGCPAAAVAQGPASPTNVKATDNGTTTTVTWTKPTVTPGTSPIVGYTVRAVAQTRPVANVTLTASEPASIVYTLDGSDPLVSADVNQAATPYTVPFTISDKDANNNPVTSVTLRYVAIDGAGNPSLARTEIYKFGAAASRGRAHRSTRPTAGNTTDRRDLDGSGEPGTLADHRLQDHGDAAPPVARPCRRGERDLERRRRRR